MNKCRIIHRMPLSNFVRLVALIVQFTIYVSNAVFAADQIATLPDGEQVVLHDDFTWMYYEQSISIIDTSSIKGDEIPAFLRQGISADRKTIIEAVELYWQGWRYCMPQPKSAQAAWGNYDGRTTWWYGYWLNQKTGAVSQTSPVKRLNGIFYGDNQDLRNKWRNGGSPPPPSKIERLLPCD